MTLSGFKESIQTALAYRSQLRWKRYVLCTNVDLTNPQKLSLKKVLPDIEFMGAATWVDLCKEFAQLVADRFNVLVPMPMPQERVLRSLNEAYLNDYRQHFVFSKQQDKITLFVYSQRRDYMFELPIPSTCSVCDVLITLRNIFNLPPPEIIEQYHIIWKHTLSINGQPVSPDQRISELIQEDKPIVTLWKSVVWYKPPYPTDEIVGLENTGTPAGYLLRKSHLQNNYSALSKTASKNLKKPLLELSIS